MRELRMCYTCEGKWSEDHECENSCFVFFNPFDRDDDMVDKLEEKLEEKEVDVLTEGKFVNQCVEGDSREVVEADISLLKCNVFDEKSKREQEKVECCVDQKGEADSGKIVEDEVFTSESLKVYDDEKQETEIEHHSIFSGNFFGTDFKGQLKQSTISSPLPISTFDLVKSGEDCHNFQKGLVGAEYEIVRHLFGLFKWYKQKFVFARVYIRGKHFEYINKLKRVIWKKGPRKIKRFQFDPGINRKPGAFVYIAWLTIVLQNLVYVVSAYFPEACSGFSIEVFRSFSAVVKLSLGSSIMLCLDVWYCIVVLLMAGWLKDHEIALDAIFICLDLQLWTMMIRLNFNQSVSVWVGNDVGDIVRSKSYGDTCVASNDTADSNRDECTSSFAPEKEHICDRPLGLKFDPKNGDIYIADPYFGLPVIGPAGGLATHVVTKAEGKPLLFTNDMDIDDQNGVIYFTDTSIKFCRRDFMPIILTEDESDRLMKYEKSNKEESILLNGLAFANGVALNQDRSFVLIVETTTCRIQRLWHEGPNVGNSEVFAELPGYPMSGETQRMSFGVALHAKKSTFSHWLGLKPMGWKSAFEAWT